MTKLKGPIREFGPRPFAAVSKRNEVQLLLPALVTIAFFNLDIAYS